MNKNILNNLKLIIKKKMFSNKYGLRIWQLIRAVSLLRVSSFRKLFFEAKKGDVCLDIGANVGHASLVLWLKGVKEIHSFEPNPYAFESLKNNISRIKNINIYKLAVSSRVSKEKLYLHKKVDYMQDQQTRVIYSQASSLFSEKINLGKTFCEVDTINLVQFIKEKNLFPNLIKCDIEGGEYLIYDQLLMLAELNSLRRLFVECHANKAQIFKEKHNKFVNLVQESNYPNKFELNWH